MPSGTVAGEGVMRIDRRIAALATTIVCPVIPDMTSVADSTEIPRLTAVTRPADPALFETTIALFDEAHVADSVTFWLVPSE